MVSEILQRGDFFATTADIQSLSTEFGDSVKNYGGCVLSSMCSRTCARHRDFSFLPPRSKIGALLRTQAMQKLRDYVRGGGNADIKKVMSALEERCKEGDDKTAAQRAGAVLSLFKPEDG